ARRLGINNLRLKLEELGFTTLYPMRSQILKNQVKKARGHRKEVLKKIRSSIKLRLKEEGLHGRIKGREKHLYSLYKKMRDKHMSFREVLDVYAFRIIVDNVDTCYRLLGVIHNLYKPLSGKFKDYIAIPKANGYQSLHTVVFGPFGLPIEVQIRTEDMHKVAEAGIAAHWVYKSGDESSNAAHKRAQQWMRELLEMQKSSGNTIEFIENVKVDLFPRDVYVFTPKGQIMELTKGATAVDFAYAVHTDVGNTCVAAKIDRHYTPLSTPLINGQTVEIVTAPWGHPNPNWLNFVVTGKARANIRNYLKNLRLGEAIELGGRLLKNALAAEGLTLDEIPEETKNSLLENYGLENIGYLLADIGLGKRIAPLVARSFIPRQEGIDQYANESHTRHSSKPLAIRGTEGMVINFGKCCRPIPGDDIHGFVSTGRGIVIHTQNCKNVAEHADRPEKLIDVEWEKNIEGDFPAEIRMEITDSRGLLATIAANIADSGANIENVSIEERDDNYNAMHFVIDVQNRQHLADVIRRLRLLNAVHRIWRAKS
ncbi:MAG: RelA/SpoT family protein, partial [Gammaproteobacteria bacterium]|nr:RelA/SpoT family protein [Gammaproteobacteria bacterium]